MAKARTSSSDKERRGLLFDDKPPAELETSPESAPSGWSSGRFSSLSREDLLASLEREAMASPSVERSPYGEPKREIPLPPPPNLASPLRMRIGAQPVIEVGKASSLQLPADSDERPESASTEKTLPKTQEFVGGVSGEARAPILASRGEEGLDWLQREIDSLYAQVQAEVGANKFLADYCMGLLSEARALLAGGRAEDFARAELDIEQVKAKLKRARESDEAARKHGRRILAWGIFWFVIFVSSLFNAPRIIEWLGWGNPHGMISPIIFISALAWGGIGGVVAGFYDLSWHIFRRDYDSQYNIFYFVEPLMGVALGGIIFLVLNTGLVALIGEPIGSPRILSLSGKTDLTPYPLYLLACLAGFKQQFAYKVLDDVMRALVRQPRG